jgi:hypothetical protein
MTDPKNGGVGYPQKPTPSRRRANARIKKIESQLEVIERLLHKPVDAVKDGQPTKMSALEAIMLQLLQKSLAGDKRADRALQRFSDFADRNSVSELGLVFVDNDYTRAFAASLEPKDG